MQIEYELTPEDYVAFAKYHNASSPETRRRIAVFYFALVIINLGVLLILHSVGLQFSFLGIWLPACSSLALMWWINNQEQSRIEKAAQEGQARGYFGHYGLTIGAEGISTTNEATKCERQWKTISHVVTTGPGVFFYLSANAAIIVPPSAFRDVQQRQEFLETVLRYREQATE